LGLPPLSSAGAKEVARLFEEQAGKDPVKLLPSLAHVLYFHALLCSKKYDLLCVSCTRLAAAPHMRGHPFAAVLDGVVNEVAAPKLARFLERLTAKDAAAPGPVGVAFPKLQAAALTIVNMAFNCEYLPERLGALLPRTLRDTSAALQSCLNECRTSPDYAPSSSYASAKQDVKAKAEGILQQIARIKAHSKIQGEPHLQQGVAELTATLRKFTAE